MTTQTWEYTELAPTYSLRPPYAAGAVDAVVERCGLAPHVADIGAGTGHLLVELLARDCTADAVEPNEAMRRIGQERIGGRASVRWHDGTGEDTGLLSGNYDIVTFGSSFNTLDRYRALCEAARLLRSRGLMACLWNHRRLDDPLQAEIERVIQRRVPDYSYGARRADQAPVIEASGLFGPVETLREPFEHRMPVRDWLDAWRSHATLARQAGAAFGTVVADIESLVAADPDGTIIVPYETVGWMAPLAAGSLR